MVFFSFENIKKLEKIPMVFRTLYPKLTCGEFDKVKKKAFFYNKIVMVCEECFYQNNLTNYEFLWKI